MESVTVAVVGAGQMGHGIAHVMLRAGHQCVFTRYFAGLC